MLVRIAAYQNAIEAHLARGRLEAEGIPAYVCHENYIWAYWLDSLALQGVKIYVHPINADRAKEIITAHDRGDYALDEEELVACPRCTSTDVCRRRVSWKSALLVVNLTSIPLYFSWATMKCLSCRHEWDLPNTRTYRLSVIAAAAAIAAVLCVVFFIVLSPYCLDGKKYFLIFHQFESCR